MSENEIKPVYPEVCPMQLDKDGGHYARHIIAMTDEGLYSKGAIAEQLGMRDREIDRLIAAGDRVVAAFRKLGETSSAARALVLRQECEASMLALDAALAKAQAGGP